MFLLIWFTIIFVLSVMPVSGTDTDYFGDTAGHFILYGLTAIFLCRRLMKRMAVTSAVAASIFIASAYGFAMEVLQHSLPYRTFSVKDSAANVSGSSIFCVLYSKWKRR